VSIFSILPHFKYTQLYKIHFDLVKYKNILIYKNGRYNMASIRKLLIVTSLLIFPLVIGLNSNAQELVTNGNFETGNTSGWSVSTDCAEATGGVAVFEAYSGTTAPITDNTILAPPQGTYAAISDYNGTAFAATALYQEIAVPSNQSVSCVYLPNPIDRKPSF
jgi:hypothetical protein